MSRYRCTVPDISVVLLSWDGLELTKRCVESLRSHTTHELEIVIVDNGSRPEVQEAVAGLADRWVLNDENRGFAMGMNQGLEQVQSPTVAYANNDTVFPPGWDVALVESLRTLPRAGIVVPAVTASGNPRTVRSAPGTQVERLLPFSEPPSGIVYVMDSEYARRLGGWSTDYPIASAEDWDLCFSVWVSGKEIYFDTRVLVEHVSKGTASKKLEDWQALWRQNRNRFLEKWSTTVPEAGPEIDPLRREQLTVAIEWMRRFYHTRDELISVTAERDELRTQLRSSQTREAELRQRATLGYQLGRVPQRLARKLRTLVRQDRSLSD